MWVRGDEPEHTDCDLYSDQPKLVVNEMNDEDEHQDNLLRDEIMGAEMKKELESGGIVIAGECRVGWNDFMSTVHDDDGERFSDQIRLFKTTSCPQTARNVLVDYIDGHLDRFVKSLVSIEANHR